MANMVFHLLRQSAMRHAADSIAAVLRPGGLLAFSAPDLVPATRHSILFHDPNRLLRHHWLDALDSAEPHDLPSPLHEAVTAARSAQRFASQQRADRRILPVAQSVEHIAEALAASFTGTIERQTFELLAEESLMTALIPSNQAEYLAEITDERTREAVIRYIMDEHVFPALAAGPAGTGLGFNIEWKFGSFRRSTSL